MDLGGKHVKNYLQAPGIDAIVSGMNPKGPTRQTSSQGGDARALSLSPARRIKIARKAAFARWRLHRAKLKNGGK